MEKVKRAKILEGVALFLILLIAFCVRIHSLSAREYSNAELADLIVSRDSNLWDTLFSPSKVPNTPLSYLITHYSISILPFELLRLQAVFFSMLGLIFFYLLARTWFGGKYALWAVLLFSINLQAIQYSRVLRAYPIFISLSIIFQYCFWKWYNGDKRYKTWYFLLGVLLIYTHFFGVVLVGCNLVFILLTKQRISKYLPGFLVTFLALLPWIVIVFLPTFIFTRYAQNVLDWIKPPSVAGYVSLISNMLMGRGWWVGFALLLVSVVALCWQRNKFIYALSQILAPLLFIESVFLFSGVSLLNFDYLSYLIPVIIIFLVSLSQKLNTRLFGTGYLLLVLVIVANLWSLAGVFSSDTTFSDLVNEVESKYGGVDVVIYPGFYQAQYEFYYFQKVLSARIPGTIEDMLRNELSHESLVIVLRSFREQIRGLLEKPADNFSINEPTLFIFSATQKSSSLQEWRQLLPEGIVGNSTIDPSKFGQFDLILVTPLVNFNAYLNNLSMRKNGIY
jgi:4-amino-4-deoxy-L-arabinose transferase-like glycosyltransferase